MNKVLAIFESPNETLEKFEEVKCKCAGIGSEDSPLRKPGTSHSSHL